MKVFASIYPIVTPWGFASPLVQGMQLLDSGFRRNDSKNCKMHISEMNIFTP